MMAYDSGATGKTTTSKATNRRYDAAGSIAALRARFGDRVITTGAVRDAHG